MIDLVRELEIDIDEKFFIGDIRSIVFIRGKFYLLANKCERMLGYFLLEIDEKDIKNMNPRYLINWKSRLDIGDA